jgi:hypothetical protein
MNAQAQAYFVSFVATKLQIPVVVDPAFCAAKGGLAIYRRDKTGAITIFVSDLSDSKAIAHELTHALQSIFGKYTFKLPELREYLLKIGLTPDEDFFTETFLPHWRECVKKGSYSPHEFSHELVCYYIEYASNGWLLFQHLCRDAGII